MVDSLHYGFNRSPRFSVNHLADYLSTNTARQREIVIRAAKFPRKVTVVPYTHSRRVICQFLASNSGNPADMDDALHRLEVRYRREPEGWTQDEIGRNIEAITAFRATFVRQRARRYTFITGPTDLAMKVEGVRINTRLDAGVTEVSDEGVRYSGGCVLFVAKGDGSRKNIDEKRKAVASIIYWELQTSNPNIEVLPRLCMSFDVFGGEIVKAPSAVGRFRSHVISACQEISARWDSVVPPADYDGPDWN